ncbi:MAG: hypothetical protein EXQ52_07740 [Bryobacterales bacterium]|nr:hypothetical protein [Bryobacterales bacterium]
MKRKRLLAAIAIACAAGRADVVEQGPKDSAPSGLQAGVARADITPPIGLAQLNWGSQTHVEAVGVDPMGMYATAIVLASGGQKFAMVDVDAIGVTGYAEIAARVSKLTGIPPEHIRLGATHTHAGPLVSVVRGPLGVDFTPYQRAQERYTALVTDKIVGAIVEANSKLRPAHAYGAKGTGTININRRLRAKEAMPAAVGRNPEGFVDRELIVIRIDGADGKPYAVLVNFQCHGTVLAYENKYFSPDWIGPMRKAVENAMPGATCLFLQGAAGNQGPVEGFTGDLEVPRRLGSILGYQAAALALGVETVKRDPKFEGFVESTAFQAKQHWRVSGPRDATMKFTTKVLDLPPRTYSPRELDEMATLVADAGTKVTAAKATGDPWKQHQADARLRRFSDLLKQWKAPHDPAPVKVRVQVMRLGDMAIVSMPGEPFAEIGVAVKKASPFAITMFCGYSSGEGGDYLPTEPEFALGGYEVQRTPYGTGAAEKLIRETIALYRDVR